MHKIISWMLHASLVATPFSMMLGCPKAYESHRIEELQPIHQFGDLQVRPASGVNAGEVALSFNEQLHADGACLDLSVGRIRGPRSISLLVNASGEVVPDLVLNPEDMPEGWQLRSRRFMCWRIQISSMQFPAARHSTIIVWTPPPHLLQEAVAE